MPFLVNRHAIFTLYLSARVVRSSIPGFLLPVSISDKEGFHRLGAGYLPLAMDEVIKVDIVNF
ncbi:MAG: hypothetical protein GY757_01650 [bacterium]|nr:hypothetical protein [bacterium]